MREAVKQKVHCSGSIKFLWEKAQLRNLGRIGVRLDEPGRWSPGWEWHSGGLGTTHLSFTCQRKMVWGPQPGCSLRKFPSLQRQSGGRAGRA